MQPLISAAPVSKAAYLAGRFLASFALNGLLLLAVPAGILLGLDVYAVDPEVLGPFRPAAYLCAYFFIALPNALTVTSIQFSAAALSRRVSASYLAGVALLIATMAGLAFGVRGGVDVGQLVDAFGVASVLADLASSWTPVEQNTNLVVPEGTLLWNRLLWLGIALGMLTFTYLRFRFDHPAAGTSWRRMTGPRAEDGVMPADTESTPIWVPPVRRTFGSRVYARQSVAIAWASFRTIATSWSGLIFTALLAMVSAVYVEDGMAFMGVPLVARAGHVLTILTTPQAGPGPWLIIPMLIIFWAGELVWREREAGLSEIVDGAVGNGARSRPVDGALLPRRSPARAHIRTVDGGADCRRVRARRAGRCRIPATPARRHRPMDRGRGDWAWRGAR
jgi:hypothetical protein